MENVTDQNRTGPFWDAMSGKIPPPPAAVLLGWKLIAIDPDAGTIEVAFEAKQDFLNPVGHVQGGILCAMLDDAMGPALVATLEPGYFAPTLELKTSFHRPARLGRLIAKANVVHKGRSVAFLEGRLYNDAGELIASASATARIVRMNQPD